MVNQKSLQHLIYPNPSPFDTPHRPSVSTPLLHLPFPPAELAAHIAHIAPGAEASYLYY
jgi:hypothetical protein